MTNKTFKSLLATTAASLAIVGAAQAGGFSRGKADTQIIYEEGNFNMRSSVTVVSPTRKYTKAPGNTSLIGEDYAETYVVPSAAVKMNVTDDLRCAATFVNNLGGHSVKSAGEGPGGTGTFQSELLAYEYGATCGYKFDLSKGRFWIVGGGFVETIDINKVANIGPPFGLANPVVLNLEGQDVGFRIGAAYEIPEIALRTELMYRSGTSYGAKGTFAMPTGFPGLIPGTPNPVPSTGAGEMPQSVEFNVQSGVAPGWLAFASVKWTDWSVNKTLESFSPGILVPNLAHAVDAYVWRDGWTVTGGVGHAFNENISGLASITWDRGVGTGYDLSGGDTWTFSLGGSVKDKWGGELRGGVGLSRLGSAEDTKSYPGDPAAFTAVGTDWAYAGSIGYAIKW